MKLRDELSEEFDVGYDDSQSIGKRYRRADEVGTPYCVTVDFETLNDQKVTIRHRDTMKQDRIDLSKVTEYVQHGLRNF
jgi:glycyl-tRNA synthetase